MKTMMKMFLKHYFNMFAISISFKNQSHKKNIFENISVGSVLEKSAEEALLFGRFQKDLVDVLKNFFGRLGGINVVMNSL